MVVPLPAASPSALITHGGPSSSRALIALDLLVKVSQRGVGRAYLVQSSLAKLFDVSIRAACLSGPKIARFCFLNASTIPAPNEASGPTTVRSILCFDANEASSSLLFEAGGTQVAIFGPAGLPGAAQTCLTFRPLDRAPQDGCSRPAPPPLRSFIWTWGA